jgi:hypothetical protein
MTKTMATYKGPSMHERIFTKKELVDALDIEASAFPDGFKELRWDSNEHRKPVDVSEMPDEVIEMLKSDPAFSLKEDGEETSKADPNAGVVEPDGSSPGVDGNPELAAAQQGDASAEAQASTSTRGRGRSTGGNG